MPRHDSLDEGYKNADCADQTESDGDEGVAVGVPGLVCRRGFVASGHLGWEMFVDGAEIGRVRSGFLVDGMVGLGCLIESAGLVSAGDCLEVLRLCIFKCS